MEIQQIKGFFKVIIFEGNNNYKVAKFKLDDGLEKSITVTGIITEIFEDLKYCLHGIYKEHSKYGMQFEIINYEPVSNDDEESLLRFFSSSLFPKVGKKAATLIVEQLGVKAFELLKEDSTIIEQIHGLSYAQIESIKAGIHSSDDLNDSILFLSQHGMTQRNIQKISATYQKDAIEIIKKNPYKLIIDIDGIGFKSADKLAYSLGFEQLHPYRLKAGVIHLMNEHSVSTGNTYITRQDLNSLFNRNFIFMEADEFNILLNELHQERLVIYDEDVIYLAVQFDAEQGIANYLCNFLLDSKKTKLSESIEDDILGIGLDMNITYEDKQVEAIKKVLMNHVSIITGGPGTGKTTIVKGALAMFEKLYPDFDITLCAPTGRAAKRLTQLTAHGATTIHSMLKWDLETNTFGINELEPLQTNVLIIDEFSMVDANLFYHTLKAAQFVDKIILIGDEHQLPSVGPGFVLKDIIQSQCFPLTRLEKIYRQEEGSDIVQLAHEIKLGNCFSLESASDVKFINANNYHVKSVVSQIVQNALDKDYSINDIQVLVPLYKGIAGIDEINRSLQELCNPPSVSKGEIKLGYRILRENDKILQLKNQPDDEVYNGDIGIIAEIINKEEDFENKDRVICNFDGTYVEYTADNFNVITHAYCISVHKSQGSEYPIVIMPLIKDYQFMLQRRLIYTGITRAKKSLILIGNSEVLLKGINEEDRYPRKTKLTKRILKNFV